ncbi:hypothetical protein MOV76_35685 [Rhizobium sp. PRIMUS64]|uniref:hypothetical protein n=1 Tax=Rhizobium sp. PRIMUS64 TaxID=2908925 RepID=UPI001FF6A3AA|nr:hypothetical protein [Rhizobium sp. PRIMUS64]MCJ9696907.1 hypothetical protein [Rhizobium sp. PRIMUS64]
MSTQGWIGIDLDGTLAHYDKWRGIDHIGDPVPAMASRVLQWHAEGRAMKIFTARVAGPPVERRQVIRIIHNWLHRHGLPVLEVTNVKDFAMIELWDDRAVQVQMNTGRRVDEVVVYGSPAAMVLPETAGEEHAE